MADENLPRSAYDETLLQMARNTCLTVAEALCDLMEEHMVVVGGLVPSLLIPPDAAPPEIGPHPGTRDVDVGLKVAVPKNLYADVKERLKASEFEPDVNEKTNNTTWHRWKHKTLPGIKIDFLIEPDPSDTNPSVMKQLKGGLSAIKTDALHLAFIDFKMITLGTLEADTTLTGEKAQFTIRVCGPAALIVLKAIAHRDREEPKDKDAFDLWYTCTYFGAGPSEVARRLKPLMEDQHSQRAVQILQEDFAEAGQIGPVKAARFLGPVDDDAFQADVVAAIGELLRLITED
ncbi:MAG: hypothetical protein R3E76_03945 [Planctomycetota bacterium]